MRMSKKNALLGAGIFYTLATAVDAVLPLVLVPLLTRLLSPYDFGLWSLFQVTLAFLAPLLGLCLNEALRMRFHQLSPQQLPHALGAAALLITSGGGIALAIVALWGQALTPWLHLSAFNIALCVVGACSLAFLQKTLAVCQFNHHKAAFMLLQALQTLVGLAVVLLLLFGFNMGWQSCAYGRVIGLLTGAAGSAVYLRTQHNFGRNMWQQRAHTQHYMRDLGRLGMRYWPFGLLGVTQTWLNRYIVASYTSVDVAGFYGLAEAFALVLGFGVTGFILAWQPWMFGRWRSVDATQQRSVLRVYGLFVLSLPVAALIMTGVAMLTMPLLLSAHFWGVRAYLALTMLQMAAMGIFMAAQCFWQSRQKVLPMACYSMATLALNAALALWWVPRYGANGAAAAGVVAYAGMAAASMLQVLRGR